MIVDLIKKIRGETGIGVMDVKKALKQAGGDEKKARLILKKIAASTAQKKASRVTGAGLIEAYVHAGRIGVLVEVNCETDFVARNPEFNTFVHNLALQIVSMSPESVDKLLTQPFIKDESQTMQQVLEALVGKIGENIVIKRFTRYELGE